MSEYIDALCGDSQLAAELSFGERSKSGVVMCSVVSDSLRVPANVVIEFCKGRYSVKSRIIKNKYRRIPGTKKRAYPSRCDLGCVCLVLLILSPHCEQEKIYTT